jgi:hypothetical protein
MIDCQNARSGAAAAVVRGFDTAYRERKSFADAIQVGVNYVLRV